MDESGGGGGGDTQRSGSEDDPLVPDIIDDEFYTNLMDKQAEITKFVRQKGDQENVDNVQRIFICCNRYRSDFYAEQMRYKELEMELGKLNEHVNTLNQMSQLDQDTIGELKGVIVGAWKQKDAAQLREQTAQDEVKNLREKMQKIEDELRRQTEKKISGNKRKADENKERDKLNSEIRELNKRLLAQRSYASDVEGLARTLEEKNKGLLKLLDEASTEACSSKKKNDLLEKDLATIKSEEQKLIEQIGQIRAQNDLLTKTKVKLNLQILSLKTNMEQLNTQFNAACNKLAKVTVDLEYVTEEKDKLKTDLAQRTNQLKTREDEIIQMKHEYTKSAKFYESTARKYSTLEEAKKLADEENSQLLIQLNIQEKELNAMRRVVHQLEKSNENITKDRDILKHDLIDIHCKAERNEETLQEAHHEIRSLKETINLFGIRQKKHQSEYSKLAKERNKKLDEIQSLGEKIDALKNEIHLKENLELELKRAVNDSEIKCAKFQEKHDSLANENVHLQKTLQQAEEEKMSLTNHVESTENVIIELKEKISQKDNEISKLQLQIDKMEKEKRFLKTEMRNIQMAHHHTRMELQEKRIENDRYSKASQEDERKTARMKSDIANLIKEKNSLCGQLKKTNSEFAELKNRLANVQDAFDQMKKDYRQLNEEMRLMGIEVRNLRTERNVLRKDRESSVDLRHELLQLHRVLNQERIKARALQDEMLTPMNIHRWRNLRGGDPEKMELIDRVQILKKQLLAQNVTIIARTEALNESQNLYEALKEFMLKLPSYKIKEELNRVKTNLNNKEKKLKAVIAELNTKVIDEKSKDCLVDEMKTSLTNAKAQLLEEKKKRQKLSDERDILEQMQIDCFSAPPCLQTTMGGGFKMTQ